MTQMAKDSFKATSKIERDIDIYFNPSFREGICLYNDLNMLLMDSKEKESTLKPFIDDKKINQLY